MQSSARQPATPVSAAGHHTEAPAPGAVGDLHGAWPDGYRQGCQNSARGFVAALEELLEASETVTRLDLQQIAQAYRHLRGMTDSVTVQIPSGKCEVARGEYRGRIAVSGLTPCRIHTGFIEDCGCRALGDGTWVLTDGTRVWPNQR